MLISGGGGRRKSNVSLLVAPGADIDANQVSCGQEERDAERRESPGMGQTHGLEYPPGKDRETRQQQPAFNGAAIVLDKGRERTPKDADHHRSGQMGMGVPGEKIPGQPGALGLVVVKSRNRGIGQSQDHQGEGEQEPSAENLKKIPVPVS